MEKKNLMKALLSKDRATALQSDHKLIKSKKLSKLTGQSFDIEIRELTPREVFDIQILGTDDSGNLRTDQTLDTAIRTCVKGITFPNLKDDELQKQYGCANANDLCEVLFGMELVNISAEIMQFSGLEIDTQEAVDEIKN